MPDLTQRVVEDYLKGELKPEAKGFFTRIGRLLTERDAGGEPKLYEPEALWSSIVFYNFVPVIVGQRPKVRPTGEMWEAGAKPFLHVLKECEAEAVLVLGKELWHKMPVSHEPARYFDFEKSSRAARRYFLHGSAERSPYRVTATYIDHPSSFGWESGRWRPVVDYLLASIEEDRARVHRESGL